MDLEAQRIENLKQKQILLTDLNLHNRLVERNPDKQARKRRKLQYDTPVRTSARLATVTRPPYNEEKYHYIERKKRGGKREADISLIPTTDSEEIRAGWTRWTPTAISPTRDENGALHFNDYPSFTPNKTPEEVIREGCFGGSYFRTLKSRKLGIIIEDDWKELPKSWYNKLDVEKYMTNPQYDADVNKFKAACGQSIEEWEASGWISHKHDIRGWFQWYCRFYMGRRCDDDDRQVSRWRKCVGQAGRWRSALLKKYLLSGVRDVFDDGEDGTEVSPVIHQTCHHWAYEVRQDDLDDVWSK